MLVRIIGVGDNVCDKYRTLSRMFPGGQALNVAVYGKMQGWDSAFLGVFGRDLVAQHVKKNLDTLEIDRSRCREYDGENGYAVVDLVDGDRVFVTSNKGGALREHPLNFDRDDLEYLSGFDLIHTSNNSYLDNQLPKLAELPGLLSYDFSKSWMDEKRREAVCPYLDAAFLSCSDLKDEQVEELVRSMYMQGCPLVLATMGERGALLWNGTRMVRHRPTLVKAVDTLGAGDSFAAGFLTTYLALHDFSEEGLRTCMEAGAALSVRICMVQGAFGYGTAMV